MIEINYIFAFKKSLLDIDQLLSLIAGKMLRRLFIFNGLFLASFTDVKGVVHGIICFRGYALVLRCWANTLIWIAWKKIRHSILLSWLFLFLIRVFAAVFEIFLYYFFKEALRQEMLFVFQKSRKNIFPNLYEPEECSFDNIDLL